MLGWFVATFDELFDGFETSTEEDGDGPVAVVVNVELTTEDFVETDEVVGADVTIVLLSELVYTLEAVEPLSIMIAELDETFWEEINEPVEDC